MIYLLNSHAFPNNASAFFALCSKINHDCEGTVQLQSIWVGKGNLPTSFEEMPSIVSRKEGFDMGSRKLCRRMELHRSVEICQRVRHAKSWTSWFRRIQVYVWGICTLPEQLRQPVEGYPPKQGGRLTTKPKIDMFGMIWIWRYTMTEIYCGVPMYAINSMQ